MKKTTILIYMLFTVLSFSKTVTLNFHFDTDSGLIYYSSADIDSLGTITTVNFNKKDVSISLKDGIYLFGFYDGRDRYLFKKLYITNDRDFKITFLPQKSIFVSGEVLEKNHNLKNVKIVFIDSVGREYPIFTDEKGNYSLNLPPEKYKVISAQFGYEIAGANTDFDFTEPDKSYSIPFEFKKSIGNIKGKILNDLGMPVPSAEIAVSNNKKERITYSDKNGNFSINLLEGITTLKVSRSGYYPTAFIKNFSRKDATDFQKFILRKRTYYISGSIINNVLPLKNQEIYLFSRGGILLDKQITNENGNFKFLNITNENLFIYIPESEFYQEYKSELITLNKSIDGNIILLEKK